MQCEVCQQVQRDYSAAVSGLHHANVQFRNSKPGSVEAAVSRRLVHRCLTALIEAEAGRKLHQARHMEFFSAPVVIQTEESKAAVV